MFVASIAECTSRLTYVTAGHQRKHGACVAEVEGYGSGYTVPVSAVVILYLYQQSEVLSMCIEALFNSAIRRRQALVQRFRQKADRLVTNVLKFDLLLEALVGIWCALVCTKSGNLAAVLISTDKLHCIGATKKRPGVASPSSK